MEPRNIRILVGISAFFVFLFGVAQVVLTWANNNIDTIHTWAFFANGCTCVLTGVVGLIASIFSNKTFAKIYFLMSFITVFEAVIVYIVYSANLSTYIKTACGGAYFFNSYCQGIKTYLSTTTGVFWSWILLLIPISTYLAWRNLTCIGQTSGIEMDKRN
ncbi:hypothetical protein DICPUDRAFT_99726 [Dictyostelium purpureum]|uniref:MARVEL domain-containing protein n=1 Tax=Dictyostelium purpureum TaxID=5786 RepID=F1A1X0_DICPU|nr:uncharacterized protein DICPUDRAFT_99726 [Dictyostelium purpureum]EGC29816.1 hypothetical protein DICPUDRAFT_99726 [Dictyostelium purpureum]|eukprot:XP_003293664.1 hypothetical protein DICPUDRAFT_99726 [Dictyostelium purpureum]